MGAVSFPSSDVEGRFYNLRDIFDGLTNEYFGDEITSSILWSIGKGTKGVEEKNIRQLL